MKYPDTYVAWDLETSGLDPRNDKILEIGAHLVVNGKIKQTKQWLLKYPDFVIPAEITAINGITNEEVAEKGIEPIIAIKEFLNFLTKVEDVYIANLTHNGFKFDIPFLLNCFSTYLERKDVLELQREISAGCIDTAVLYKAKEIKYDRMWNESFLQFADRVMAVRAYGVRYSVSHCCKELGIDMTKVKLHRALADSALTIKIFENMINDLCSDPISH